MRSIRFGVQVTQPDSHIMQQLKPLYDKAFGSGASRELMPGWTFYQDRPESLVDLRRGMRKATLEAENDVRKKRELLEDLADQPGRQDAGQTFPLVYWIHAKSRLMAWAAARMARQVLGDHVVVEQIKRPTPQDVIIRTLVDPNR